MRNLSFSTSGQLLATVRVGGGVGIWDPINSKCLQTIVCDQLSMVEFSPHGSLLAVGTSYTGTRLRLYNIMGEKVRCYHTGGAGRKYATDFSE
jgi:WD40 repeat protein